MGLYEFLRSSKLGWIGPGGFRLLREGYVAPASYVKKLFCIDILARVCFPIVALLFYVVFKFSWPFYAVALIGCFVILWVRNKIDYLYPLTPSGVISFIPKTRMPPNTCNAQQRILFEELLSKSGIVPTFCEHLQWGLIEGEKETLIGCDLFLWNLNQHNFSSHVEFMLGFYDAIDKIFALMDWGGVQKFKVKATGLRREYDPNLLPRRIDLHDL